MKLEMKIARKFAADLPEEQVQTSFGELVKSISDYKSLTVGISPKKGLSRVPIDEAHCVWVAELELVKDNFQSADAAVKQLETAERAVRKQASMRAWEVLQTTQSSEMSSTPTQIASCTVVDLPVLTGDVFATQFARFYDREPHIRFIYDSARAAAESAFEMRNHVLLWGEASGAKSSLLLAFTDWFGENKVWRLDATTITKAGLETELYNKAKGGVLPPFLVLEEIEAAPEANLYCLLQVMDERGRIQRTNARTGDRWADCKIVVWATCNDHAKLQQFKGRALWSRFGLRLRCDRPDEDLMRKILKRAMREKGGKETWVDPVVDFMFKELSADPEWLEDYDDTRLGLALLASGDRILDAGPEGALADYRKVMAKRN